MTFGIICWILFASVIASRGPINAVAITVSCFLATIASFSVFEPLASLFESISVQFETGGEAVAFGTSFVVVASGLYLVLTSFESVRYELKSPSSTGVKLCAGGFAGYLIAGALVLTWRLFAPSAETASTIVSGSLFDPAVGIVHLADHLVTGPFDRRYKLRPSESEDWLALTSPCQQLPSDNLKLKFAARFEPNFDEWTGESEQLLAKHREFLATISMSSSNEN